MKKEEMEKLLIGVLVLLMLAVLGVPVAAQNEVYFIPQDSSALCCNNTPVEIWADATGFQGGQINLTYDPTCANVTSWVRNTTNFMLGGWTHYHGREWITFTATAPLSGKYLIGTLTIQPVSGEGCSTALAFAELSELFDDRGEPISAIWTGGTFRVLSKSTPHPSPPAGDGGGGGGVPTLSLSPTPSLSITPVPTLMLTPAVTPIVSSAAPSIPAPSLSLRPSVMPNPIGFKAIFGIAGLLVVLVVAYMMLRHRGL